MSLLELLPDEEQILAKGFIKRMMLAWDGDFTKVMPSEWEALREDENDIEMGIFALMKKF